VARQRGQAGQGIHGQVDGPHACEPSRGPRDPRRVPHDVRSTPPPVRPRRPARPRAAGATARR
jgi:hypothetical protein